MGSRHQVCSLDLQIVNRRDRQAPAHAHPALSVVQAAVDARLGAGEQQPLARRIRAHHAGDLIARKIAVDRLERSPTVRSAEQVRLVVGKLVACCRYVNRVGVVRRDLDAPDIGELRHARWRDILPAVAVVARDMNEPIIGRGPDLARPVRRGSERCACRVHLCPAVFIRDIATGRPLSGNIVETEIRRNFLPAHALVAAAEHMVASRIQYPAVVR